MDRNAIRLTEAIIGGKMPHSTCHCVNACADEKQLFRRADKILYLAKDFGGNQSVAMFDILEIPLTAAEHIDFAEYLEQIPASERALAAKRFVDLRLAGNQAPVFWNYPYQKYLEDA